MPDVRCVIKIIESMPVIVAPAEIDICNAAELRAALLLAVAQGHPAIAVDMSATQFCDSAGLSVLVRARRLAVAEGSDLRLAATNPQVERILSVTGLDHWFPCFRSLAEAAHDPSSVAVGPGPRTAQVAEEVVAFDVIDGEAQ